MEMSKKDYEINEKDEINENKTVSFISLFSFIS